MKNIILILMMSGSLCFAQYNTNFYAIPDKTPTLGTNNWQYPETPGLYFWNGFRTALVAGLVCIVIGAGVAYWTRE